MSKHQNSQKNKSIFLHGDPSLDLYLKEIGETPLIDADEEVRLARRIKKGDKKALEKLTKANLRFVVSIAKHYQNQGLGLGDLINEGNIGLIKAAKRFDETRGFKFISYAVWSIRQSILAALAEQSRIVRLPLNRVSTSHKISKAARKLEQNLNREPSDAELANFLQLDHQEVKDTRHIQSSHLSLDEPFMAAEDITHLDILADTRSLPPDVIMEMRELKEQIAKALHKLIRREAMVIERSFGLNEQPKMTLDEIGVEFDLTRERVRQIKEKAIRRLKHATRSKPLRDYYEQDRSS